MWPIRYRRRSFLFVATGVAALRIRLSRLVLFVVTGVTTLRIAQHPVFPFPPRPPNREAEIAPETGHRVPKRGGDLLAVKMIRK